MNQQQRQAQVKAIRQQAQRCIDNCELDEAIQLLEEAIGLCQQQKLVNQMSKQWRDLAYETDMKDLIREFNNGIALSCNGW